MVEVHGVVDFVKEHPGKEKEHIDFSLLSRYEGYKGEFHHLQVWSDNVNYKKFQQIGMGEDLVILCNVVPDSNNPKLCKYYPVSIISQ